MEFIGVLIDIVNIVFAAFGVFVGVETLKLRIKGKIKSEKEVESENVIRESFNEEFLNTEMGGEVAKSESRLQRVEHDICSSNFATCYRSSVFIGLNKFRPHPDILNESKGQAIVSLMPVLSLYLVLILVSLFLDNEVWKLTLIAIFLVIILLPFGIYGESGNGPAKVVYSFFSMGPVKNLKAIIYKKPNGYFEFTILFYIRFFGFNVVLPKDISLDTIDQCVREYLMVRRFCGFGNGARNYSVIESAPYDRAAHVYYSDIKYGWIKLVCLLWGNKNI